MFRLLAKKYSTPGDPAAFSSPDNLRREYERQRKNRKSTSAPLPPATVSGVLEAVRQLDTYVRFKEAKKPSPRNPSYHHAKRSQIQTDLVDVSQFKEWNKGTTHLLNAIDTFTRFAWSEPLPNKSAAEFLKGFKRILKRAGTPYPRTLLSDRGSETTSRAFTEFCRDKGIRVIFSDNLIHAPFVERFNRTLKNLVYRYMNHNDTRSFVGVLPDLVKSYNSRYHRSIRTSPRQAEKPSQALRVREALALTRSDVKRRAPRYRPGQTVRVSKLKGKFSRGFDPQFADELFRIKSINRQLPLPTYELETADGKEAVKGNFYESEFTPVPEDGIQEIEKVLQHRTVRGQRQALVRFKGSTRPTWIPSARIIET